MIEKTIDYLPAENRNHRTCNERMRVRHINNKPSMTKQEFKKDCDVNLIVKKFVKTGLIDHVSKYQGTYEDLPSGVDFHAAVELVNQGSEAFKDLPAEVRSKFVNDPERFLTWIENPDNRNEAAHLGLLEDKAALAEPGSVTTAQGSAEPAPPPSEGGTE